MSLVPHYIRDILRSLLFDNDDGELDGIAFVTFDFLPSFCSAWSLAAIGLPGIALCFARMLSAENRGTSCNMQPKNCLCVDFQNLKRALLCI